MSVALLAAPSALPVSAGAAAALCAGADPEVFFPETPAGVQYAKSLCHGCPIRRDCLAGALERREPWGVWGGEWIERGQVVAVKRPRGRPRKDAAARWGLEEASVAS
jgi:WhiB family redox-sensing transcriptional regulator